MKKPLCYHICIHSVWDEDEDEDGVEQGKALLCVSVLIQSIEREMREEASNG